MNGVVPSRAALWTGRVLSALVVLFLLFDAAIKLIPLPIVAETMQQLGYSGSAELARGLGMLILVGVAFYVNPRTAVLGAILLTGLFGGTIATHLRAGSPVFTHMLFGAYLGVMAWLGLFLRDPRLRVLLGHKVHGRTPGRIK
jgi:DoxX-like family